MSSSVSKFVNLKNEVSSEKISGITYEINKVIDSDKCRINVVGDVLGNSFENLDNLIIIPCGCGEQTIITLAPLVYVIDYLNNTGKEGESIIEKAKSYAVKGYMNQLRWKRNDSSYSAWGNSDPSGSVWLVSNFHKN